MKLGKYLYILGDESHLSLSLEGKLALNEIQPCFPGYLFHRGIKENKTKIADSWNTISVFVPSGNFKGDSILHL